ncbi:YbaN family protein [Pseudoxanthobacter sp. M-2]|uniref:YbaN family protein n=1 Tax=Pseudoxanthobacter sp. M-2 TaxID=3078754 RepID=UPI0038FC72F7
MRTLWLLVGCVALVAAVLGAVLPLVPTVPFLLVGVFAFSRSSPRLESWLLEHPHLGPPIHAWQRNGAISRRSKAVALATMVATPIVSLALGVTTGIVLLQCAVLAAVAVFILSRPEPDGSARRRG